MSDRRQDAMLDALLIQLGEDIPEMPSDFHAKWKGQLKERNMHRFHWQKWGMIAATVIFVLGGTLYSLNNSQESALTISQTAPSSAMSKQAVRIMGNANSLDTFSYDAGGAMETAFETDDSDSFAESAMASLETAPHKIIRTVSMTVATQNFSDTVHALTASCQSMQGWISSSTFYTAGNGLGRAELQLKLPSDTLDDYLADVPLNGRILYREERAEDLTESYQDQEARLETQKQLMRRLQELVGTAARLEELLALENEIADTQYRIDTLEGSLKNIDQKVSYATVNLSVQEEAPEEKVNLPETSLSERLLLSLRMGCAGLISLLGDALVLFFSALPFLFASLILWLLIRTFLHMRRRNK